MLTHSILLKPVLWGRYTVPSKIYMRSWPVCSLLYGNQCSPIPDLLCTMTQRARNLKTRHICSWLLAGFLFTFHQWEVKIDLWVDGSVRFPEASCTSLQIIRVSTGGGWETGTGFPPAVFGLPGFFTTSNSSLTFTPSFSHSFVSI